MATEARVRRQLEQERRELAEAVDVLREDIGEVTGKAKKGAAGAAGLFLLLRLGRVLLRLLRRND